MPVTIEKEIRFVLADTFAVAMNDGAIQLYEHLVNHIFIVQRKSPQIAMILLARIHIAPIRVRLCGDQMLFDGIR